MAAVSQFAGDTLLHAGGSFEPQRKSNFALVVYDVGDIDSLVLSLKSTNVPEVSMAQGGIKFFNETMRYAGSVSPFADGNLMYNDYIDRKTLAALSAWMKQVWNPANGAIGWARDYKKTADIMLLPPGMPGNVPGAVFSNPYQGRVWHLEGVWPKTLKSDDLDHSDEGTSPSLINLVLSVDRSVPGFML